MSEYQGTPQERAVAARRVAAMVGRWRREERECNSDTAEMTEQLYWICRHLARVRKREAKAAR